MTVAVGFLSLLPGGLEFIDGRHGLGVATHSGGVGAKSTRTSSTILESASRLLKGTTLVDLQPIDDGKPPLSQTMTIIL